MVKTLLILVIALTLPACVTMPSPDEITRADYGTIGPSYKDAIKDYLAGILYDPESARYRYLQEPVRGYAFVNPGFEPPEYGYLVEVRINAKNRLGGYVGEQPFTFLVRDSKVWHVSSWTTKEVVK